MSKETSKLSAHSFVKGKFVTPINTIPGMTELTDEKSWTYGRLPEYLWIGLILKKYGRTIGLEKMYSVILALHRVAPDLRTPRMSSILSLPEDIQLEFFDSVSGLVSPETLAPLTLICTYTEAPVFSKFFYTPEISIDERLQVLTSTMRDLIDHQSHESTDIRFVVLFFGLLSEHLIMQKDHIDLLLKYPQLPHAADEMRMIRPFVRSSEMMLLEAETCSSDYLQLFWRCVSEMTDCNLFIVNFPKEERDVSLYMENVHEIFSYLADLYASTQPLDEKMTVILGIATYSYKRFKELYDYHLFNSIVGRSSIRTMIEAYIVIKYLVKNEENHENIWRDYQVYGLGLYKLVLSRYREQKELVTSHFETKYIELLINEFRNEEFLDMDTRYFDKQNMRQKAESVGEKDLFGLYYDYDSSFEHALWGAVRECAMLKCDNPTHQYHCVPDVEGQQTVKSVLADCIMVMNKTLSYIRDLYGIPDHLYEEVINYEKGFNVE